MSSRLFYLGNGGSLRGYIRLNYAVPDDRFFLDCLGLQGCFYRSVLVVVCVWLILHLLYNVLGEIVVSSRIIILNHHAPRDMYCTQHGQGAFFWGFFLHPDEIGSGRKPFSKVGLVIVESEQAFSSLRVRHNLF